MRASEVAMLELFRFIEQAFPTPTAARTAAHVGDGQTPFQRALIAAKESDQPAEHVAAVAEQHLAGDSFMRDLHGLQFGRQLTDLAAKLEDAQKAGEGVASLDELIRGAFDMSAADLLADSAFQGDRSRLDDDLLALKLAPDRGDIDATQHVRARRTVGFIEMAASHGDQLTQAELIAALKRPLIMDPVFLPPRRAAPAAPAPPQQAPEDTRVRDLVTRVAALHETWQALMSLQAEELALLPAADRPIPEPQPAGPIRPAGAGEPTFVAKPEAIERFSETVRATLDRLNLRPDALPVPTAVQRVKASLMEASRELGPLAAPAPARVYRVGGEFFAVQPIVRPLADEAPAAPAVAGAIKPFMIGNLQVVKQELIGYEPAEVSHIENVLVGETYRRHTERRELSESTVTSERETLKSEERDLQSTERNELRQEAQRASTQQATTTAGQTISTAYGSLVDSQQSQYGRSVTDQAVNKLSERVREQRVQREQKVFIERSSHDFSNTEGPGNLHGIYQWVDKKFKARVLNYGTRLLFDVVVAEPAAFFLDSLQRAQQGESLNLVKPSVPSVPSPSGVGTLISVSDDVVHVELSPDLLHAGNYLNLAARYGVTGSIEPPPADFLTTVAWVDAGETAFTHRMHKIQIPPGYVAVEGYFQRTNYYGKDGFAGGSAEVHVGYHHHYFLDPTLNEKFQMKNETGEVPITFAAGGIQGYNIAVGIVCRSDSAYQKWQLKTYTAIMEGYKRQLEKYEERLAQLQTMVRTQMLLSKNYAHDPTIERTELKKALIHLLMSQHYPRVNVPTPNPTALPKNLAQESKWSAVVAFFERALEWDNMMYTYYPYFWARPGRWAELVLIQDLNPQFEAFLKAGAARVVVPARPGFEAALAHYQETGEIWLGKDMPEMFSEMYVSILDEIAARNAAAGEEKVVEEWEMKLPTTLVLLRDDAQLPKWP